MRADDFLSLPYTTIVARAVTTHGATCFIALHPEFPGCLAQGDSPEAAKADLLEATKLYIQDLLEKGDEVPKPTPQPTPPPRPVVGANALGAIVVRKEKGNDFAGWSGYQPLGLATVDMNEMLAAAS